MQKDEVSHTLPMWLPSNSIEVWTLFSENRKARQIRKVMPAKSLKLSLIEVLWFGGYFFFPLCNVYPGKKCSVAKHVRNSKKSRLFTSLVMIFPHLLIKEGLSEWLPDLVRYSQQKCLKHKTSFGKCCPYDNFQFLSLQCLCCTFTTV